MLSKFVATGPFGVVRARSATETENGFSAVLNTKSTLLTGLLATPFGVCETTWSAPAPLA